MRRVIYLIIIVAAVGAIIAVGYYFRYQGVAFLAPGEAPGTGGAGPITLPPVPEAAKETGVPDKLGTVAGKEPTKIASGQVFDYFVYSATSSVVFQADGQVALLTQSGAEVISSTEIKGIVQAGFSYNGGKLAVIFGERSAPQASIFDIQTKSWSPLSDAVYSFAWSPSDGRLAYLAKNGANSEIKTLDAAKANAKPQTVLSFAAEDIVLSWPRPDQILASQMPSAKVPGSLLKVDVAKKTLLPLVQDQNGLDAVWSGVSDRGLVFESGLGEKGGTLRLADSAGQAQRTMSFITLPEKCVFYAAADGKENLLCGVPLNYDLWNANALPDAYLKKEIFSRDWIYRVDVGTGDIEVIYDGAGAVLDATNLRVKDGVLYFKNRLDGSLYGLNL